MHILLTGATGFIGGHILAVLNKEKHCITCLVRPGKRQQIEKMALTNVKVIEGEFTKPRDWLEKIDNCDIIINTVGIIRETKHYSFREVHADAPMALFDWGAKNKIKKIIQISAMGADQDAQSQYHLSKRQADEYLSTLNTPYIIIRPSIVYGPGDQSMTFFTSLAALPITFVPGDGQYKLQPVHIEDLVQSVVQSIAQKDIKNIAVDLGGSQILSFDKILDVLANWLGKKKACKIHLPWLFTSLIARGTDLVGRGPITREELSMLKRGNYSESDAFTRNFNYSPVGFEDRINRTRRDQAKVWHAYLYHLRIFLRLTVAFIWIATGLICAFVYPEEESLKLLAQVGIKGNLALVSLYGICLFEVVLGFATAFGVALQLLGMIQILLMLGFTVILTFGMPELWWHPFGPLTKNIPLIGATLAMMAIER